MCGVFCPDEDTLAAREGLRRATLRHALPSDADADAATVVNVKAANTSAASGPAATGTSAGGHERQLRRDIINLGWLCVAASVLLAVGVVHLFLTRMPAFEAQQDGESVSVSVLALEAEYSTAVRLYALAAVLEMIGEPL